MSVRSLTLLTLALLAASCSPKKSAAQDPNTVATVDGKPIDRKDFEQQLAREAQAMEGGTRTPEQLEPFKRALLDTLIERTLLLQAASQAGVTVTADEVDRRLLALSSEYPAGTFDEVLEKTRLTKQDHQRLTREQLIIEKLLQAQVFTRVAVTEAQVQAAYEEHPEQFTEPEQVHAAQIVVKNLDDAKHLQQLLWQGKKFQDLARKYSRSPDAKVGGDLGFFGKGQMPAAFDEVFRMSVNQVSEVVSTDYGFHLFKVLEKRPARKKELPEVRARIERDLVQALRVERQKDYVDGLRQKAEIKVNDQTLMSVTARLPSGTAEP